MNEAFSNLKHVSDFIIILLASFVLLHSFGCRQLETRQPLSNKKELDKQEIINEVQQHLWAFHAADTARDAQGVIDLLWPEFTMLVDGNRTNYAEVAQGSPEFMNSLDLFHTEWTDVQIIPISADAALSSFLFRDSIITKSGKLTRAKGPNTFLWERRNGIWKVLYADADHYPINE